MCYTAPTLRLWREARGSSNDRLSPVAAAAGRMLAAGAHRARAVPDRVAGAAALQAGGPGGRGGVRAAAGDHSAAGARPRRPARLVYRAKSQEAISSNRI